MARGPEWFRNRPSGILASQLVDSVESLGGYFARFLPAMLAAAVLPIAFAVGLMRRSTSSSVSCSSSPRR